MVFFIQLQTHPDGVLHADAAKSGARANLDRTHAQPDRRARFHTQFVPDLIQVLFPDSHQGNALGRSNLDGLHVEFFRHIGQLPQQVNIRDNAPGDVGRDGEVYFIPL